MSEKLTIEGFAGLKKVSIDLRKINLFIGPQATGKSVVAKLLHLLKSIPAFLLAGATQGMAKGRLYKVCLARFEQCFPVSTWGEAPFFVHYECGDVFVKIRKTPAKTAGVTLSCSTYYGDVLRGLRDLSDAIGRQPAEAQAIAGLVTPRMHRELSRLATERGMPQFYFHQVFIDAGRSFFANVQQNVFRMISADATLDPFLREFGAYYERCRDFVFGRNGRPRTPRNRADREIDRLVEEILGARCAVKGEQDVLEFPDGRVVDIGHVSSGQQETHPLAVILQGVLIEQPLANGKTLYIEEPEAHLFPVTQRRVVELLATVYNADPVRSQLVVTTHSPYILTALNNLLQAGRLAGELGGNASALKRLHRVVPKTRLLSAGDVSAYYFDGMTARSIMTDDGLIEAAEIDSVSEDLAIQFGKILDIGG